MPDMDYLTVDQLKRSSDSQAAVRRRPSIGDFGGFSADR